MDDIKIDKNFAALKLIEILFEKGLLNQETYSSIKKILKSGKNIADENTADSKK